MSRSLLIAKALSAAFLAGDIEPQALVDRAATALGKRWPWLPPLARRVAEEFSAGPPPRQIALTRYLLNDDLFQLHVHEIDPAALHELAPPTEMRPVPAARHWALTPLGSPADLAAWLEVTPGQLEWFADLHNLHARYPTQRLRHYRYRLLPKTNGQLRLLEAPKPRLKALQRRLLDGLLAAIPPHPAAHGFRPGHSIKSFAQPHVGRHVVLRIDLREFFPSITTPRVRALLQTAGYPEPVADLLSGLCTSRTPSDIWQAVPEDTDDAHLLHLRRLYAQRHLPQGAPTSPALANLAAYRLDCRLAALAAAAGATYTRYADDLAFSGEESFERRVKRFRLHACAIAMEEGFVVHHRKTRIMRQGVRQHLAGIVINERTNVRRADYDRLKATLTNCLRHGAESQNRAGHEDFRAHLLGRVSFVAMLHPARGQRLKTLFEEIAW